MKMEFPGLVTQDVVKREGANEKLATIDRRTTTQAEEETVEKRAMSRTTRKQSLP
jgi:hypothetical protein